MKLLFIPVSVTSGLLAGFVGKKLFEQVWGVVDDREPPEPEHRYASWGKVLLAGALQGAIFKFVRTLTDRGTRQGFQRLTGTWPGEERPDVEA